MCAWRRTLQKSLKDSTQVCTRFSLINHALFVYVNNAHTPTIAYSYDIVVPKKQEYFLIVFFAMKDSGGSG